MSDAAVYATYCQLKCDYIPDHGDCLDMVCFAAGWNKDRARELQGTIHVFCTLLIIDLCAIVDTHTYTDFFVGTLLERTEIDQKVNRTRSSKLDEFLRHCPQSDARPRFGGIFVVSYGLSRAQLENFNYLIRNQLQPVQYDASVLVPVRILL